MMRRTKNKRFTPARGFTALAVAIGLGMLLVAPLASGQGATASVSAASGQASSLIVGPYVAEPGARLAIELVRHDSPSVVDGAILAIECRLADEAGALIKSIRPPDETDALAWIAAIDLTTDADDPIPAGRYHLVLETDAGTFTALVDVVPTSLLASHPRFSGTAIANGLSLRVSRWVAPSDAGRRIAMRLGDELLVALPGNPTTGFEWWNSVLYEYAVLRPIGEIPYEFRADSDPQRLGSSGVFLFRYQSVAADTQWFRFIYHRPWESVEPTDVFEFTAIVH